MKNKPYPKGQVETLFLISISTESRSLRIFLQDLPEKQWKQLFPDALNTESYKKGDYIQSLIDIQKKGYLAEVHIPECKNFTYKDGQPIDCSYFQGVKKLAYVYAENHEKLFDHIDKLSKDYFYFCAQKEKNNETRNHL